MNSRHIYPIQHRILFIRLSTPRKNTEFWDGRSRFAYWTKIAVMIGFRNVQLNLTDWYKNMMKWSTDIMSFSWAHRIDNTIFSLIVTWVIALVTEIAIYRILSDKHTGCRVRKWNVILVWFRWNSQSELLNTLPLSLESIIFLLFCCVILVLIF